MHPVEEYQNITLTVDGLNECDLWRSQEEEWALNYYITQCTGSSISWRQDAVEKASTQQCGPSGPRLSSCSWISDELEIRYSRENQHSERLGPQASGWAAQENGKEMRSWPLEWGSICCSYVPSPTPFHTQPFQIKWEVYFSKELCSSSLLCRRYDSSCMQMYMYYVAIQRYMLLWHINHCRLFNAKFSLYLHIRCIYIYIYDL